MTIEWTMCFSPYFGFCCNVISQPIISRVSKNIRISIYASLLLGLATNITCIIYCHDQLNFLLYISYTFYSIITYFALSFCYWCFLNLNQTSLRLRIVRELIESHPKKMKESLLLERYSPQELVSVRLQRLALAGKIAFKNQYWELCRDRSQNLLFLAFILQFLRKIIIPRKYLIRVNKLLSDTTLDKINLSKRDYI